MIEQLADYHIHTTFCNHANGTMRQYVKQAISAGLREMGFSDHNPLPAHFNNHYRMLPDELQIYLNIINDLQIQFQQIKIRVGVELDYIEEAVDYLGKFVAENNFDYIIGSVHYLNMNASQHLAYLKDIHNYEKAELFQIYFENIEKAIATGLFDIIAHFDLPRRFWGDMDDMSMSYAVHALELMKKYDLCLEINTSGFRTKNVEEPFPGSKLLHLAKEWEIPVTLGSDAHKPGHVGSYFDEAIALLKEIGFEYIHLFANRQRIPLKI